MTSQTRLQKRLARGAVVGASVALALSLVLGPGTARADHSLNQGCIICHSLRSTSVVLGTRNILQTEIAANLYQSYWYCAAVTFNGTTDRLDCSYCHGKPLGDPAGEIALFSSAMTTTTWPVTGSAHPVDVEAATVSFKDATKGPMKRILCNDCHGLDVAPKNACDKTQVGGGYPNHAPSSVPANAAGTGANRRPGHVAETWKYLSGGPLLPVDLGPTGPDADWTGGALNDMLCFKCHKPPAAGGIASDIKTVYDRPGGGHNLQAVGTLAMKKLPCYDCHDPHASVDKGGFPGNRALIISGADEVNGFTNPQRKTKFKPTAVFTGATSGDRVVCTGCHGQAGITTEGVVATTLDAANVKFAFHAGVHDTARTSGNCLQAYNGCHQSPHNTDIYRCLDCHSPSAGGTNAKLLPVEHVGDEFAALAPAADGSVKLATVPSAPPGRVAGQISSRHDIVYDDTKDMTSVANNGCLGCHNVPKAQTGKILADLDGAFYGSTFSSREALVAYDPFCLSCHDNTGTSFGTMPAPEVYRYWDTAGHGRPSGNYRIAAYGAATGNVAAKTPCLECHVYHGSTAYKLLPGDQQTTLYGSDTVKGGRVVKGFGYPAPTTIGTDFSIGGVTDSTYIDYADYTDPLSNSRLPTGTTYKFRSRFVSNYTEAWSTYSQSSLTAPKGIPTYYGTSGDMRSPNTNSTKEVACGKTATNSPSIGFCNVCHFYKDSTNGTAGTAGWVYTHEDNCGGDPACDAKSLKAQKNFFKDCAECHDPHGSGTDGGTTETYANLAMVRGKLLASATNDDTQAADKNYWQPVVFTSPTGTTASYDPSNSGKDSSKAICVVCHTGPGTSGTNCSTANALNVDHNYRAASGVPNHYEGKNCTLCHAHGKKGNLTNSSYTGFGLWGTCTGCHGLPPIARRDPPLLGFADCAALAASQREERCENYPGGGGAHWAHMSVIMDPDLAGVDANLEQKCSPCHGPDPGAAEWHLESTSISGYSTFDFEANFSAWPTTPGNSFQNKVDLVDSYGNLRAGSTVQTGRYTGGASGSVQTIQDTAHASGAANAKGGAPQECSNINCHGAAAPYNATPPSGTGADDGRYYPGATMPTVSSYPKKMRLIWEYEATNTAAPLRPWVSDLACAGCHGSAPAMTIPGTSHPADVNPLVTIRNLANNGDLYTSALGVQGVTGSYFGTVSGYGRGGHGDRAIQSEDPFVDSAPGYVTPSHCTDCHDDAAKHFDPTVRTSTNLVTRYRLKASPGVLESTSTNGVCNTCHPRDDYPGENASGKAKNHHRSYYYYDGATRKDVIPAAGTKVMLAPPAGYSATGADWNVDFFVNFWESGTDNPTQTFGAPQAVLPLEQYVAGGTSTNKVLCVTCHNPHGTDLFTYDLGGTHRSIPDNNMLRLRDQDNTLCVACHP
ncbi:MAG: hypothetical protein HZB55_16555 [Deltaproteobacteria bacterium]|nr:hypothetical protein [Deltaproteobacteria bacterium]